MDEPRSCPDIILQRSSTKILENWWNLQCEEISTTYGLTDYDFGRPIVHISQDRPPSTKEAVQPHMETRIDRV